MPDWCTCKVEFRGPPAGVDAVEASGLDFEAILPTPAGLLGGGAARGRGDMGWCGWREANWGCKWSPDVESMERVSPGVLRAVIGTPRAVPARMLERLTSDHPGLEIEVVDHVVEGGTVGRMLFRGGEVAEDDTRMPAGWEVRAQEGPGYEEAWKSDWVPRVRSWA